MYTLGDHTGILAGTLSGLLGIQIYTHTLRPALEKASSGPGCTPPTKLAARRSKVPHLDTVADSTHAHRKEALSASDPAKDQQTDTCTAWG